MNSFQQGFLYTRKVQALAVTCAALPVWHTFLLPFLPLHQLGNPHHGYHNISLFRSSHSILEAICASISKSASLCI